MSDNKSVTIKKQVNQISVTYDVKNYDVKDAAFMAHFLTLDKDEQVKVLQQGNGGDDEK